MNGTSPATFGTEWPTAGSNAIAAAPCATACAANCKPWLFKPGNAMKSAPGGIARLSRVTSVTETRGTFADIPASNCLRFFDVGDLEGDMTAAIVSVLSLVYAPRPPAFHERQAWALVSHRPG